MGLKKDIKKYLKDKQPQARYKHILGVQKTAKLLGEKWFDKSYGVSKKDFIKKLELAALLHDLDKGDGEEKMWENILSSKIDEDLLSKIKKTKEIWHAFSAAYSSKKIFNITDEDILNAIRYHTTGRRNMTIYDKIIYLADYTEPHRDFPRVNYFRKLSFEDIDKCMIEALESTTEFVRKKGNSVNILSLEAEKYLKKKSR